MYVILPTYTTISIQYCQLFRVISRYSWLFMVIHVIKPTAISTVGQAAVTLKQDRMIFADFTVNSEPIFLKFCKGHFLFKF